MEGGVLDQPWVLIEGLLGVHDAFESYKDKKRKEAMRRAK